MQWERLARVNPCLPHIPLGWPKIVVVFFCKIAIVTP